MVVFGCWLVTHAAAADDDACLAAHEQAQLLRQQGQLIAARGALLGCAQSACPQRVSADCAAWLDEVERGLPSVVFAVTDPDGRDIADARVTSGGRVLTVRTDGHALAFDPGAYRLRVEAPGYAPAQVEVTIREAEKNRILRLQLKAAAPVDSAVSPPVPLSAASERASHAGPAIPLGAYVLGGTALAALAAGVTFALVGNHSYAQLQASCAPRCAEQQLAGGKREYVAADVGFGVAAASAAAAVIVLVAGRASARADAPVQALVTRDGAYVGWRTRL